MRLLGLVLHDRIVQILDAPQRVGQPRRHRRSGRQLSAVAGATQSPAEVVVGDLESHGGGQICQFLAESHRESREPLHEGSKGQVVPFDVARAYRGHVAYVLDRDAFRSGQLGRRVTARLGIAVLLYQNAVANRGAEGIADRRGIGCPAIRRELRAVFAGLFRSAEPCAGTDRQSALASSNGSACRQRKRRAVWSSGRWP